MTLRVAFAMGHRSASVIFYAVLGIRIIPDQSPDSSDSQSRVPNQESPSFRSFIIIPDHSTLMTLDFGTVLRMPSDMHLIRALLDRQTDDCRANGEKRISLDLDRQDATGWSLKGHLATTD